MYKYEMGDIVWVNKLYSNPKAQYHLFVIIDDDGKAIPIEYFGFIVSSNLEKSKEKSKYKYNELINKNNNNRLRTDSIVKCDQIFKIPNNNINCKIGTADTEDLIRFINSYNKFLNEYNI